MSACAEWKETLVDLVYGELDDVSESRLNEHLGVCAECRREEAALLRLRTGIGGEPGNPSTALRERIRAAVRRQERSGRLPGFLLRPIPVYAALVAMLLGVLLTIVFPRGGGPGSVPGIADRHAPPRTADRQALPFHVAGSYDTGVHPALLDRARSTTAPPETLQGRDSL